MLYLQIFVMSSLLLIYSMASATSKLPIQNEADKNEFVLTEALAKDYIHKLNRICGDTFCAGDFMFRFKNLSCQEVSLPNGKTNECILAYNYISDKAYRFELTDLSVEFWKSKSVISVNKSEPGVKVISTGMQRISTHLDRFQSVCKFQMNDLIDLYDRRKVGNQYSDSFLFLFRECSDLVTNIAYDNTVSMWEAQDYYGLLHLKAKTPSEMADCGDSSTIAGYFNEVFTLNGVNVTASIFDTFIDQFVTEASKSVICPVDKLAYAFECDDTEFRRALRVGADAQWLFDNVCRAVAGAKGMQILTSGSKKGSN